MTRSVANSHSPGPGDEQRPSWRAALSVYRRSRLEGHYEWECYHAAVDAFQTEVPDRSLEEARAEVRRAILWASINHNAWLFPRNEDGSSAAIPNPHQRHWLQLRGLYPG